MFDDYLGFKKANLLYGNPPDTLRDWASNLLPDTPTPRPHELPARLVLMESMEKTIRQIKATTIYLDELRVKLTMDHSLLNCQIRNVPDEVLAHILAIHFNSTFESMSYYPDSPEPMRSAPLSVCRKWRRVALASPGCWANLVLSMNPDCIELAKPHLLRLFSLSGTLTVQLVLVVESSSYSDSGEEKFHNAIQDCLTDQTSKLQSYAEVNHPFSRYSQLDLLLDNRASNLTHLRLETVRLSTNSDGRALPALKYLFVSQVYPEQLETLLGMCPFLESFAYHSISKTSHGNLYETESRHQMLPGLLISLHSSQRLSRITIHAGDLQEEFSSSELTLPNIKTINLYQLPHERCKVHPRCLEYLLHVFPNLEHLVLTNTRLVDLDDWTDEFDDESVHVHGIQQITFQIPPYDIGQVMDTLVLFPSLKSIHLNISAPRNLFLGWDGISLLRRGLDHGIESVVFDSNWYDTFVDPEPGDPIFAHLGGFLDELPGFLREEEQGTLGSEFVHCKRLECVELSGVTIPFAHIKLLLELLEVRQGAGTLDATGGTEAGIFLTLNDCPLYLGAGDFHNMSVKNMDYLAAQKFFQSYEMRERLDETKDSSEEPSSSEGSSEEEQ
jgi:hypothetical protein